MKTWLYILMLCVSYVHCDELCECSGSCQVKDELGRDTWGLLHKIVEHVPSTEENEETFQIFLQALSKLYPCDVCRQHFQDNLLHSKLTLHPRSMCNFHNRINTQLGKEMFDCDLYLQKYKDRSRSTQGSWLQRN